MNARGFTMVELLIVSGVAFGLWGGLALLTTDAGNRVWARADSQMATMSVAQRALNRLAEDLRAASLAGGVTCQPGDISFTQAADGAAMRYRLDAATGELTRTEGAASRVVAGNVSALTFPSCTNGVVRVALTARVASGRWPTATHTLESHIRIRNP
jgi:hypothetical protein